MRQERTGVGTIASLTAGAVVGVVEVVLATSFAALIFAGALSDRLPDGVGLYLVSAVVMLAVHAWTGHQRGGIGSVQDGPAVILAVIAASIASSRPGGEEEIFLTVVAAVVTATLLTGIVSVLLGSFRLGNAVRFVPYPVIGGFLAGTGWLLAKGGVGVAADIVPTIDTLDELLAPATLARWVPAVVFAVTLLVLGRAVRAPLLIPGALGVGIVLFAIAMAVTGSSITEAQEGGWLLGPFPETGLWQPWAVRAIGGADWGVVLAETAGIATVVFVSVVAMLLNASGIELMLGRELDPDRELRIGGTANLIAGAAGGIPGFPALSLTSLAQRMAVSPRVAGFVGSAVALATLTLGGGIVALIPRMLLGGTVLLLGLGFLVDWVIDARRSLPRWEWIIVLAILATIIGWGLLPGVAVGLVLALVLFAVSYSRADVVRSVSSGVELRSNVDRPLVEREALRALGEHVHVIGLQGFVFFGTATEVLDRIRDRVRAEGIPPVRFLVVDLRRVTGVDSSAVLAFQRAAELGTAAGFQLVLTGATPSVRRQIQRGIDRAGVSSAAFEPDLDRGLQRCEDALLASSTMGSGADATDTPADLIGRLQPYLERVAVQEGSVLLAQGDPPDDVFLLESGRLRVEMATQDGARVRLRTMRPGIVVGEIALYSGRPRTADVVAEEPSVVLRLSRASIDRMRRQDPSLAADVHRWFASMLADRLGETLHTLDTLTD